jgi:hypothetical protein
MAEFVCYYKMFFEVVCTELSFKAWVRSLFCALRRYFSANKELPADLQIDLSFVSWFGFQIVALFHHCLCILISEFVHSLKMFLEFVLADISF